MTEYVGKDTAQGARAEHECKTVEDVHQIYQINHSHDDKRNNLTPGMATPEHKHRSSDGQHGDWWTEYHDNEKCTTKKICGPHATNMLQMQTRRTLRQRLSTNY